MIHQVTLGVALAEADHKVREEGGNNKGPRIRQYLEGTDPPITIAAPWCAAFVQYCSDVAARGLGMRNPLDDVRHEALVQSYFDHFQDRAIPAGRVRPGDLVLFRFPGPPRWNHIGIVAQPPNADGIIWSVEGNTGDVDQRDGDGVYLKPRKVGASPITFLRWWATGALEQ